MSWTMFNCFVEDEAKGVHNLSSDTLKVALTNTAPDVSADTVLTDITQIASTGGYVPASATVTTAAQSGGTFTLALDAIAFTPSGAAFASARYWVLYNDTAASKNLIGYADYGTSYAAPDGVPWTLNAGTVFTQAQSA